ncbi:hypothetical protein AVEN_126541-1, partial [Araneus ventricosus]
SPFLVEKALSNCVSETKSVKKLRCGDLQFKFETQKQRQKLAKLKSLANIPVSVNPHGSLNSSKGFISIGKLLNEPIEQITEDFTRQGVTHLRRITVWRDGQLLNT